MQPEQLMQPPEQLMQPPKQELAQMMQWWLIQPAWQVVEKVEMSTWWQVIQPP